MRKRQWLRYGLASVAALGLGLGAMLVACGDDDSGGGSTTDGGGNDSGGGGNDSGNQDSGNDSGPKPTLAKLTLVNAATDLGPHASMNAAGTQALRVCFKQGKADPLDVAPYPPLPHEPPASKPQAPPGVYLGTGGAFPSFGIDLSDRKLVPIIMNAATMYAKGFVKPTDGGLETSCDEILDPAKHPEVKENEDYWVLDEIPAGTFALEKSYILALTGCPGDTDVQLGPKCGSDFAGGGPGKGNLKVTVLEVTRTAVAASGVGVQFAHLSAAANAVLGAIPPSGFPVEPGFTANPKDAGAYRPISDGGVAYKTLTPAVAVPNIADSDFFASNKQSPTDPGTALAPFPLPAIQALSGLGAPTPPTVYTTAGKNFVFIAVGDPDPATPTYLVDDGGVDPDGGNGGSFNLRKYHYLAFPTDPDIQAYKP